MLDHSQKANWPLHFGRGSHAEIISESEVHIHVWRTLLIRDTLPLGGSEEQCDSKELRRNNLILIAISQEGVEAIEL